MLATPWPGPFSDDGWVFELKWDGVRCLLTSDNGVTTISSRAGNDMSSRYPELIRSDMTDGLVLDGEIVALDTAGRPSFESLQGRMNTTPRIGSMPLVPITYVVFDLLFAGESLIEMPLEERHERLSRLELAPPIVVGDRHYGEVGPVWSFVVANDLEGVVAKRLGSRYQPGIRSSDWRKVGNFKTLRAVVGGFTAGTGGRAATFGALLLGLWVGDSLRLIGAVGSGFDDRSLRAVREALDQMRVDESPFHPDPDLPRHAVWVQPQLVAMVRYKQWTAAGRVRAPSFLGFTDDPITDVTWAAEGAAEQ